MGEKEKLAIIYETCLKIILFYVFSKNAKKKKKKKTLFIVVYLLNILLFVSYANMPSQASLHNDEDKPTCLLFYCVIYILLFNSILIFLLNLKFSKTLNYLYII